MAADTVRGYCPMGCGETLLRTPSERIMCSSPTCPRPFAVADLLDDQDTEHIAAIGDTTFVLLHPLRERLDGDLFDCTVHERISALGGPPVQPGSYRVTIDDDGEFVWLAVPDGH